MREESIRPQGLKWGKLKNFFSLGHVATISWLRDLAIATAIALLAGFTIAGAANLTSSPPAPVRAQVVQRGLDCRRLGVVGVDGNTAWAVAQAVAPKRLGDEALQQMQKNAGNSLSEVVPGQELMVPVPC